MRFIPITHMGVGTCIEASGSANVISGSFTTGSETWNYYEFSSSNNVTENFNFTIKSGYTNKARIIVVGGGGAGGSNGAVDYGTVGGGGGGGKVVQFENAVLTPTTYTVTIGKGGDSADPTHPTTPTYNGGDGDYSAFVGGIYTLSASKADGGEGGYGDSSVPATYGDGGNSGNGFLGGQNTADGSGGGAGSTSDGFDGNFTGGQYRGGDGGTGSAIDIGYTSPTLGVSIIGVAGGGGGIGADAGGQGVDGGGQGAEDFGRAFDASRHTGGGGGGGQTSIGGLTSRGGDGIVIVTFPTGSCLVSANEFNLRNESSSGSACYLTSSVQTYYTSVIHQNLGVGVPVFTTADFSTPVTSSYLSDTGKWYFIGGTDGVITETGSCDAVYSIYNDDTGALYSQVFDINYTPTDELSLSVWFRNSGSVQTIMKPFVLQPDGGAKGVGLIMEPDGISYSLVDAAVYTEGPFTKVSDTEPFSQIDLLGGDFKLHTMTWNKTSGNLLHYVNGSLLGSGSYTSSLDMTDTSLVVMNVTPGQDSINLGEGYIYSRELSSIEVSQSFEDTKARYGY